MLDIPIFFKSLPRTSSICRKLLDRAIQSWTMQFITRWQQDLYIFTTSCHLVFPASSTTVGLFHPHHFRPCHLLYLSHIISLTSQSKHESQCKSTSIRYIVCENLLHFLPIIFYILFRYFLVLVLIYLQFIVQCIVSSSLFDMIFIWCDMCFFGWNTAQQYAIEEG